MVKKYKLIVIGAGSGGLTAAEVAARFGAKVALIEATTKLGGECLHTGCVPSKALIHAATTHWQAQNSSSLTAAHSANVDFSKIKSAIHTAIDTIENGHDSDEYYRSIGVDIIHGKAIFIDKHSIQVNEDVLRGDKIIIATGSRPSIPAIDGLNQGPFLTNETIFQLDSLPESLIVIGGGPIGCELGQAFAMLGTSVSIVQSAPRLLPRDSEEAADRLATSFETMGIAVYTNSRIKQVTYEEGSVTVTTENAELKASHLLIATGRTPTIPEGLEKAGVKVNEKGIQVNARLQTSRSHVYAIGDCNGMIQLTHTAGEQASSAVQNALYYQKKEFTLDTVCWTTFTTPEIAQFGPVLSEATLSDGLEKYPFNYESLDRAVTENSQGFGSIVVNKKGTIVAATIVGDHAGELLAHIKASGTIDTLATTTQPYPTYASGLWQVASSIYINRITRTPTGKLLRFLSR